MVSHVDVLFFVCGCCDSVLLVMLVLVQVGDGVHFGVTGACWWC